jgi:Dolichyl-phosphate-mannose-protein mannosyltransferase
MIRRMKPGLIIFWIIFGIILPNFLSTRFLRKSAPFHGLIVSSNRGSWYAADLDSALRQLPANERVSITGFIWSSNPADRYIVVRGAPDCVLELNKKIVLRKNDASVAAASFVIPPELSEWNLAIEKNQGELQQALDVQWSKNYVTSQKLTSADFYNRPVSKRTIRNETIARVLGVMARLNIVLLAIWILLCVWNLRINIRSNKFLIAGMLVIFGLRFAGIGYQMQELLHPDERMYGRMIAEMSTGKWAPSQFLYTTGYFMLTVQAKRFADWIFAKDIPQNLVQRSVSAVASCLACVMVFFIAKRLFSRRHAVLAMFLFGFSYIPIEVAHFGIVESCLLFFFLFALYQLIVLAERPSFSSFFMAGFAAGLAVAVKQTAAIIVVPSFICFAILARNKLSTILVKGIVVWIGAAFLGFVILSPGTFLEIKRFYRYQVIESQSMQGKTDTSLFFAGQKNRFGVLVLKSLQNGVGLPLLIAAVPGLFLIWKKSRMASWLLISPAVIYFVLISKAAVVADHYVLILCPFVAWFAVLTLTSLPIGSKKWLLGTAVALLLLPSLTRVFTLERLLEGVDTRRQAAQWCYKNIPAGQKIYYETFGPRLLIPSYVMTMTPLFHRSEWQQKPGFFLEDDITSEVFSASPQLFAVENRWYTGLRKDGELVHEFHSEKFRLLNPVIQIYRVPPAR